MDAATRHAGTADPWTGPGLAADLTRATVADEMRGMKHLALMILLTCITTDPAAFAAGEAAETLQGRWRLLAAEDLRGDGTVARLPWGRRPVGSIVVEGGFCYVQIMSSDVPSFSAGTPVGDQMTATLLSSYIAYSGACVINDTDGSVTLTVASAWRPDYVGTEQKRYFRFEHGRLLFGPAPGSIRNGNETLTRRLTLERAAP